MRGSLAAGATLIAGTALTFIGTVPANASSGPIDSTCDSGNFCIYKEGPGSIPGYGYEWTGAARNYANYRFADGTSVDNTAVYWWNNGNSDNVCVFQYSGYGGSYKFIPRGSQAGLWNTWWFNRPSSHYWVSGSSC